MIGCGAVLGANIRFLIYKKLENINFNRNYIILLINTLSSFLLGFFLANLSHLGSLGDPYKLGIFFSIGLLGCLSTFSSFVYDLYDFSIKLKFYRAFQLFLISLTLGILSFAFGFLLRI